VTSLVRALEAVERADPFALRTAVEAMGKALAVLSADSESDGTSAPDLEATP